MPSQPSSSKKYNRSTTPLEIHRCMGLEGLRLSLTRAPPPGCGWQGYQGRAIPGRHSLLGGPTSVQGPLHTTLRLRLPPTLLSFSPSLLVRLAFQVTAPQASHPLPISFPQVFPLIKPPAYLISSWQLQLRGLKQPQSVLLFFKYVRVLV